MTTMSKEVKKPRKSNKAKIEIIFKNNLEPSLWRKLQEDTISMNLRDHIPAHLQRPLVDKFVEAGLMRP